MTYEESERRWAANREKEARLIAAEEARRKGRELGWRIDMLFTRISAGGRKDGPAPFTKDISWMSSGVMVFDRKSFNAEEGSFSAYGSTFGPPADRQGDIVRMGAFRKTIRELGGECKMLWNHNGSEIIGMCSNLREDRHGLKFDARLTKGTQRGREALALISDGFVDSFSIGYSIRPGGCEFLKDGTRALVDLDLWEVSCVGLPANPRARLIT